jgi:transaldolase / glucose-6-phosphate isomerase
MTIKVFQAGSVSQAVEKFVPTLVADKFASKLFAQDHTLWGKDAEAESAIRLGWVNAASVTIELIPELSELRQELLAKGLTRVVLCGMGGSSLAPEVITKTFGRELVVLDSTDPSQVKLALSGDLNKTVVVVSSKSGSTVETDSQKRSFEQAFTDAGISKTERIFVVTDPNSPMHNQAVKDGYRVFLADPMVGGRYSALTAFGAVPSMLAGVDMKAVLEDAVRAAELLNKDDLENPGLIMGAAMAKTAGGSGFKDKIGLVSGDSKIIGFGDWAEQLIAESTGKIGLGVLPVVLQNDSAELRNPPSDLLLTELTEDASSSEYELAVSGTLGEQLLLWEVATAVAARLLGVNPFDQPDVESAKTAARALLDSPAESTELAHVEESIRFGAKGFAQNATALQEALEELFAQLRPDSFVSINCYLNREAFGAAEDLRNLVAIKTGRPTTFGWGPRFLHSTGQYHKGGPRQGVFLQIVSGEADDQIIPGREFGYRQLIDSQANGDATVLAEKGLPVLVLSLSDPASGIKRLMELLSK